MLKLMPLRLIPMLLLGLAASGCGDDSGGQAETAAETTESNQGGGTVEMSNNSTSNATSNETTPDTTTEPVDMGPAPRMTDDGCSYPGVVDDAALGELMPPLIWNNARGDGAPSTFDLLDVYCNDDVWGQYETVIFMVTTTWSPKNIDAITYLDAISTKLEKSAIVYVVAQNDSGFLASSDDATDLVSTFANINNSGIRVGEANNTVPGALMDTSVIDGFPTTFVVRRSDMTIVAAQFDTEYDQLPFVEISKDPEADWTNPPAPIERPVYPSRCEEGAEESYEPNDSPLDAARLEAGVDFMGGVCWRVGDFYNVDISGRWNLSLEFTNSVGDLDIALFSAEGTPIYDIQGQPQGAFTENDTETLSWNGPAVIYVHGYDGATGPYRLKID